MWNRTKRLINSKLDELIEKASGPDRDVRGVTRAEIARLHELEVQTMASLKMFEKELAEIELKMIGVGERERIASERGDVAAAGSAGRELMSLASQRDLLKQQIAEARGSAARARALRDERGRAGEELATETHLTKMKEDIAGLNMGFDPNDPASTLDEMRTRLNRPGRSENDARLAEAEHQFEQEQKRARVDEMLDRYKQTLNSPGPVGAPQSSVAPSAPPPAGKDSGGATPGPDDGPEQPKTLGRSEGPLRPID